MKIIALLFLSLGAVQAVTENHSSSQTTGEKTLERFLEELEEPRRILNGHQNEPPSKVHGHHKNNKNNNKNTYNHNNNKDNQSTDPPFPVDISPYSIRFEKCQGIKTGNTQQQQMVNRFAVFRLCPRHECSATCDDAEYGEYSLPLGEYLSILSKYFHETKGALCDTCRRCRKPEEQETVESKLADFGSNCVKCDQECTMLNQLENNKGYADATDFIKCTLVHSGLNGEKHYAGPVCSQSGDAVTIGIFTDEYCAVQDTTKDIRHFVKTEDGNSAQLAYSFMKLSYLETCLSCAEDGVEGIHDLKADERDADNVKSFCENIYDKAIKCETPHGFPLANTPPYTQTAAQEVQVCDFIGQIHANKHAKEAQKFIGGGATSVEAFAEEEILDAQTLIMIIVGAVLLLLLLLFKCFCNSNASLYQYASVMPEERSSHDIDDQVIKVSVSSSDDVDVTENESSSSMCE